MLAVNTGVKMDWPVLKERNLCGFQIACEWILSGQLSGEGRLFSKVPKSPTCRNYNDFLLIDVSEAFPAWNFGPRNALVFSKCGGGLKGVLPKPGIRHTPGAGFLRER